MHAFRFTAFGTNTLFSVAAFLSLAGTAVAAETQPATSPASPPASASIACTDAATLVIDGYAANTRTTRAALKAFAAGARVKPLIGEAPVRSLEGGMAPDHFIAAYKFACQADARAAMAGGNWDRLIATLKPSIYQRITLFASDPGHSVASPATPTCNRPAYFLLKGLVSDSPRYFEYLRALMSSGLLTRHEMRREVVMSPTNPRLQEVGTSYGKGEFFEILRFPCVREAEAFWNSPEYRAIVPLRVGAMRADVWLYE